MINSVKWNEKKKKKTRLRRRNRTRKPSPEKIIFFALSFQLTSKSQRQWPEFMEKKVIESKFTYSNGYNLMANHFLFQLRTERRPISAYTSDLISQKWLKVSKNIIEQVRLVNAIIYQIINVTNNKWKWRMRERERKLDSWAASMTRFQTSQ